MSDFLAMGGYAFYVWSAYGLVLALLVVNAWLPLRRHRRLRRRLAQPCSRRVAS